MNLRTILFSQYPALFLLAVLFLIAHLRVRKTSAVKSVLWVILFGAALAASVGCCFLGIQAELWTLKTLITLGFWSWFGVGLVLLFLVLRVVHGMEKRSSRRRLDKAMKQAEKQKEEEVRMLNEMKNNACEEMERLRSELSKMEQSKQNKKALLETVQKEIDEAKEVISSQEHIIQEKDETIRHLKEALDRNDSNASADAAQLKEENAQLREQLKSVIEENKSAMESENDLVSSLEAALVLLEANVKAKKDRLDALQAAMDGVK